MTFRSPKTTKSAFVLLPGGNPRAAELIGLDRGTLLIQVPNDFAEGLSEGDWVLMAKNVDQVNRGQCVPGTLTEVGEVPGQCRIQLDETDSIWVADDLTVHSNRRQSFRVSTLDYLDKSRWRKVEALTTRVEQGATRFDAELLDLSLSGCGLRIQTTPLKAPPLGTRLFVQVEGPDLDNPLRLPAMVKRFQSKARWTYLGLSFLRGENITWNRVEQEISRYVIYRQQKISRGRAG